MSPPATTRSTHPGTTKPPTHLGTFYNVPEDVPSAALIAQGECTARDGSVYLATHRWPLSPNVSVVVGPKTPPTQSMYVRALDDTVGTLHPVPAHFTYGENTAFKVEGVPPGWVSYRTPRVDFSTTLGIKRGEKPATGTVDQPITIDD